MNQFDKVISIINAGAKTEQAAATLAGYTSAVVKGAVVGVKKGFFVGWNYNNFEVREAVIEAAKK